ncbi:MAG: hypothetical protein KKB50_07645 [Planctomycetes bacterium]|nr:hypothetical protein [Planctomycetota bacterium]
MTALLWPNRWGFTSPVPPATPVAAWVVDTSTVRRPALAPETRIGAFRYRCNDCHRLFTSPPTAGTGRSLRQHRHIVLKHGLNDNCFNCHSRKNRDVYISSAGAPIPADQPQLLCAQCHGPVYRDWLQGVHGRSDGYWNKRLGPLERKTCVECHDPHVPPFPPMRPAPGPSTLRMGDPAFRPSHAPEATANPLLIYRQTPAHRAPAPTTEHAETRTAPPAGERSQ